MDHSSSNSVTFYRAISKYVIVILEPMTEFITSSSAVAKRPRDASCLYSFYTLKWCGYPMVKKIRTYVYSFWHDRRTWKNPVFTYRSPHFCFPWRCPCDYHAICCMDVKTIQCLPNRSQYVHIFNSFRVIRCLSQCVSPKIAVFTTFLFPLGTPLRQSC